MQKAIIWCLTGVVIGVAAYFLIDRFATPQPVLLPPDPVYSPAMPSQPERSTPERPGRDWQPVPATASTPGSTSGIASDDLSEEFRTDIFDRQEPSQATQPSASEGTPRPNVAPRIRNDEARQRIAELREVQAELAVMIQDPNSIDLSELDAVLSRMEQMEGLQASVPGVDFSVLRSNLESAAHLMAVSERVSEAVSQGATPEQLHEHLEEMQALQIELQERAAAARQ